MGKRNKNVKGVISSCITINQNEFKKFYDVNKKNVKDDELLSYLNHYIILSNNLEPYLLQLSLVEELILQMKTFENLDNISLSNVNGYIYARCPMFRTNNNKNDVRVVVGKTKDFGDDFNLLLKNKKFVAICQTKLKLAVIQTINITKLKIQKQLNKQKEMNELDSIFGDILGSTDPSVQTDEKQERKLPTFFEPPVKPVLQEEIVE